MNTIYSINGPVVKVRDTKDFSMGEMVYVGQKRLMGEVIIVNDAATTIQVYEETSGLRPGEPVLGTGSPISVTLGPGIISNIYDGVQRPLGKIEEQEGAFIGSGVEIPSLDPEREWDVTVLAKDDVNTAVSGGISAYDRVLTTATKPVEDGMLVRLPD